MNKKIMLAGVFALAGFMILSAFGGKTKEQQQQEIAAAIQTQLDEYAAQLQEECTIRVNEEAQRRFDEYQASLPADAPKKPATGKKKSSTSTTKKDPMPQEKPATNPKQDKMQGTPNTEEKQEKMQGTPNTDKKKAKMKEGGGN